MAENSRKTNQYYVLNQNRCLLLNLRLRNYEINLVPLKEKNNGDTGDESDVESDKEEVERGITSERE